MTTASHKSRKIHLRYNKILTGVLLASTMAMVAMPAAAQQAGTVNGTVTSTEGTALPGVVIEARSNVLPGVRTATSTSNGRYQLPLLPPGQYELTFINPDGTVTKRNAFVSLQQKIKVDVAFTDATDEVIVIAQRMQVDTARASLKNNISNAAITGVPVGQEYRDLQKLIPGVQYSEDSVRGPSAGGSGQDNIYQFDGVDVSTPLFGTLGAEPSTHDIEQVSVVRGGATAVGFNRSGGFTINTISKRGTNEFHGEASYKIQSAGMASDRKNVTVTDFNEDKRWITANLGGPVIKDKVFFYGSYYRPTITRENGSNAVGAVPDFKSERNEYFGKLTVAPTSNITLDGSYRTSTRTGENQSIGGFGAVSTSTSSAAEQDIAIVEGSWVIDNVSSFNFKYTNFKNKTTSSPDNLFDFPIGTSSSLDVSALDTQGLFVVPILGLGDAAYDAFAQPLINQYGFQDGGVQTGGGTVGGDATINRQDFFRNSFEASYNRTFNTGDSAHDLHIGYQRQNVEEDLARTSNGWGVITAPGGRVMATDGVTPIFYQATLNQLSLSGIGGNTLPPSINSQSTLQSFEINDTIENGNWTINLGVVISKDTLFGQGLREKAGTISGFEVAAGNKYKMYESDWGDMIQPRIGVKYDYSDEGSVYANFARYNPSASSLARAASWDRNLQRTIRANFDVNGNLIEIDPVRSSSGKFFQDDLDPRKVDEYLIGWDKQINDKLAIRTHARYRGGSNFWEDTNNNARTRFNAPAEIAALGDYIPNLADVRAEIGGSSYVIAQLDNAHTNYYEAAIEGDYRGDNFYLSGSYVWSQYRGNFDQDNTTTGNDGNIFIGSSNLADGAGRQLWDNKDGTLRGDRPHQFKLYGFYEFPWDGRTGFFANYQSGQPWEKWDVEVYRSLTGSTSDTIRFAEAAGSRRTDAHFQFDLNYTQNFEILNGYNIELRAELFNVFNSQTGYNIQSKFNSAGFGDPRSSYNPRRLQLTAKASF